MSTTRHSIANYATQVAVNKTVAEVQHLLAAPKATAILSEFDGAFPSPSVSKSKLSAGFRRSRSGHMSKASTKSISPKFGTREQAARVAWRIILHWLTAQLAMVEAGLVKVEEVFLPYAQDAASVTVYERLRERQFSDYLLPEKSDPA
jgi:hypothetical protein